MTLFEATVLLLMMLFCITNLRAYVEKPPVWYGPALFVATVLSMFTLFFTVIQGVRP